MCNLGFKNLLRCALLAVMGTATGIVIFCTLPDLFSNLVLHRPLPFWMQDSQVNRWCLSS